MNSRTLRAARKTPVPRGLGAAGGLGIAGTALGSYATLQESRARGDSPAETIGAVGASAVGAAAVGGFLAVACSPGIVSAAACGAIGSYAGSQAGAFVGRYVGRGSTKVLIR